MTLQPVSSIFPVLHCPLGLVETHGCQFPDVVFLPLLLFVLSGFYRRRRRWLVLGHFHQGKSEYFSVVIVVVYFCLFVCLFVVVFLFSGWRCVRILVNISGKTGERWEQFGDICNCLRSKVSVLWVWRRRLKQWVLLNPETFQRNSLFDFIFSHSACKLMIWARKGLGGGGLRIWAYRLEGTIAVFLCSNIFYSLATRHSWCIRKRAQNSARYGSSLVQPQP